MGFCKTSNIFIFMIAIMISMQSLNSTPLKTWEEIIEQAQKNIAKNNETISKYDTEIEKLDHNTLTAGPKLVGNYLTAKTSHTLIIQLLQAGCELIEKGFKVILDECKEEEKKDITTIDQQYNSALSTNLIVNLKRLAMNTPYVWYTIKTTQKKVKQNNKNSLDDCEKSSHNENELQTCLDNKFESIGTLMTSQQVYLSLAANNLRQITDKRKFFDIVENMRNDSINALSLFYRCLKDNAPKNKTVENNIADDNLTENDLKAMINIDEINWE